MPSFMKIEHLNPFIQATIQTFATMLKTEIKAENPKLWNQEPLHCDASACIWLSGGAKGVVALCFPRLSALKIVSAFTGEKTFSIGPDAIDALGEIANIVAGSARKELESWHVHISLPAVVMGDGHSVLLPTNVPYLRVPFESSHGTFELKVAFKSEDPGGATPP